MSAVLHPGCFGDPAAIRLSQIGNAVFARAMNLGYGQVVARALANQAKREAGTWESANEVAMRLVRPKHHSATVPHKRGPGSAA